MFALNGSAHLLSYRRPWPRVAREVLLLIAALSVVVRHTTRPGASAAHSRAPWRPGAGRVRRAIVTSDSAPRCGRPELRDGCVPLPTVSIGLPRRRPGGDEGQSPGLLGAGILAGTSLGED